MAKKRALADAKPHDTAANLGFEAKFWLTADKLRNNMDAAEYMFVQSEKLVEEHDGSIGDIAANGQESN